MKTDLQLKSDILKELSWDPAVQSADVSALVRKGVVTLLGHLESHAEKRVIEHAVQRVHGVKALVVEMDVRLSAGTLRPDAELAAAAAHSLAWHCQVPAGKVLALVENGWVTLNGELAWNYQRQAAEHAVRNLVGVRGVTNLISIVPQAARTDLRRGILEALLRQTARHATEIEVLVANSQVTLRGRVHSWAERKAAQTAAWCAPGVASVVNQLRIDWH